MLVSQKGLFNDIYCSGSQLVLDLDSPSIFNQMSQIEKYFNFSKLLKEMVLFQPELTSVQNIKVYKPLSGDAKEKFYI